MNNLSAQHVIKHPKGGWAIKKVHSSRPTKIYKSKRDAIECGKQISKNKKVDLYIHNEDGTVEYKIMNYKKNDKKRCENCKCNSRKKDIIRLGEIYKALSEICFIGDINNTCSLITEKFDIERRLFDAKDNN